MQSATTSSTETNWRVPREQVRRDNRNNGNRNNGNRNNAPRDNAPRDNAHRELTNHVPQDSRRNTERCDHVHRDNRNHNRAPREHAPREQAPREQAPRDNRNHNHAPREVRHNNGNRNHSPREQAPREAQRERNHGRWNNSPQAPQAPQAPVQIPQDPQAPVQAPQDPQAPVQAPRVKRPLKIAVARPKQVRVPSTPVIHRQKPISAPVGETDCHFVGTFKGTYTDASGKVTENFETRLSTNHKFTLGEGDKFYFDEAFGNIIKASWMNTTTYKGEFTYTTKGTFERGGKCKPLIGTLTGVFTGTISGVLSPCTLDKKFAPFI